MIGMRFELANSQRELVHQVKDAVIERGYEVLVLTGAALNNRPGLKGGVCSELVTDRAISDRLLAASSADPAKPAQTCKSHEDDACQRSVKAQNHSQ